MRIAAFDLGSNSTRMLIAETRDGVAIPLIWRTRITRLAERIGEGRLLPEALTRTVTVLDEYAAEARRERVARVRAVATSAVRDAANADELLEYTAALHLPVEVLSGDREAELTHLGASAEAGPGVRCLIIDIGGGSTELVLGAHGTVEAHASLNLGCVRSSERYPMYDPPLRAQVEALEAITLEAVRHVGSRFGDAAGARAIAVAGTATSLAAVKQRLDPYDSERVHGFVMTRDDVVGVLSELATMTTAQRRALPWLEPERADTIVTGAAILLGIMKFFSLPAISISEHGILYGLALELAAEIQH